MVEMLIMRGARINVMNRGDDTPLHLAASHGHRDIVQKVWVDPSPPVSQTHNMKSVTGTVMGGMCTVPFLVPGHSYLTFVTV